MNAKKTEPSNAEKLEAARAAAKADADAKKALADEAAKEAEANKTIPAPEMTVADEGQHDPYEEESSTPDEKTLDAVDPITHTEDGKEVSADIPEAEIAGNTSGVLSVPPSVVNILRQLHGKKDNFIIFGIASTQITLGDLRQLASR